MSKKLEALREEAALQIADRFEEVLPGTDKSVLKQMARRMFDTTVDYAKWQIATIPYSGLANPLLINPFIHEEMKAVIRSTSEKLKSKLRDNLSIGIAALFMACGTNHSLARKVADFLLEQEKNQG